MGQKSSIKLRPSATVPRLLLPSKHLELGDCVRHRLLPSTTVPTTTYSSHFGAERTSKNCIAGSPVRFFLLLLRRPHVQTAQWQDRIRRALCVPNFT